MKFRHTEPDDHLFLKFESEQGLWSFGLYRTLYGIRVQLVQGMCISLNYCAGANLVFAGKLLFVVARILGDFEETMPQGRLERQFPHNIVKPMPSEDGCWEKLLAMAEKASPWDRNLDLGLAECLEWAQVDPRFHNPMAQPLWEVSHVDD